DKIIDTLTELVGDVVIEDLPITYTSIATDFINEKEVWMNSGKLLDAIRASISLPLIFTPFKYNNIDLIDGGVLNPVPIAPTLNDVTDLTIAVNLVGKADNKEKITIDEDLETEDKLTFTEKITEFVGRTVNLSSTDMGAYDIAH
uniref:patatin-like phospholipase family protein n=1 Tax=Porticoccus sp. TaxID=2024853 RepID=UPI003F6985D4